MAERVCTPDIVTSLAEDEILVFGNNAAGDADTPMARLAREKFGAEMNNPEGLQGSTYSVAVQGVTFDKLKEEISVLLDIIYEWDQTTFLVTPLAIAESGFSNKEIAPLFADAIGYYNIRLPREYLDIISRIS
ncbi:MAG: hypothetical protein HDS55_06020 [Barnesiella sp.]|nr:hypothetical protein [Barnesiella sp.]